MDPTRRHRALSATLLRMSLMRISVALLVVGSAAGCGDEDTATSGTATEAGTGAHSGSGGSKAGSGGAVANGGSHAGGNGGKATTGGSANDAGPTSDARPPTEAAAEADTGVPVDGDASSDAAQIPFPAPHPTAPQLVKLPGNVIANPKLVPVFFSNDDTTFTGELADFETKLVASIYWKTVAEYGVGAGTTASSINLTETAGDAWSDTQIQTWLAGKINANDPAFAFDQNTVFVLHFPSTTTVTRNGTEQSCQSYGAYHDSVTLDQSHAAANVAYVVVPRCPAYPGFTAVDTVTAAASGALLGAVTDPYPLADPAWVPYDDDHFVFTLTGGGEVETFCGQDLASFRTLSDLPYLVQRIWSNGAAAANHDPCVPAPGAEVYFNSAPVLPDTALVGGTTTKAVKITAGQSRTIDLDLFSDAATSGPWTVSAFDYNELQGRTATLSFSLDRTTGKNGDVLNLTIHAVTASSLGSAFLVKSELNGESHTWVGLVVN